MPKLLSELTSAVMDENPRFSEVLNLSELRSILYFVPSPPFWRRHTDIVTKNMLTISTKPSACMSVHIDAVQIEGEQTSGVEAFTTNHVP